MSVWDWVECGLIDKHVELPAMTGSFGVTIGDAVAGFFGARHTHIFGADIKLVADPEDLLLGQLEHALPLVTALLGGVGGNVTFCYGTNLTATYMGPKMEIRRAKNISKTTDYYFKPKSAPGAAGAAAPPPDPVDPATLVAVSALSLLVVCVPAALELAIRFKYPQYGVKGASEETLESYGETPGILKLCAYMVTSRLMALLKMIEDAGSLAQIGEEWSKTAEYIGTRLEAAGTAAVELKDSIAMLLRRMGIAIREAAESVGEVLAALAEAEEP